MLAFILWLPSLEFLGESFFGRCLGKGVVLFITINLFFLCLILIQSIINNGIAILLVGWIVN